jgi:hypothetical protein
MEAGSHSGIARLVQQSLGTSALFPSYVCATIYITCHVKRLGSFDHAIVGGLTSKGDPRLYNENQYDS